MEGGASLDTATEAGRAAALLGRPVAGTKAGAADLRCAAGILHDLVVWGLDARVPDAVLRPVEARLAALATERAAHDPPLACLLDWWGAAVVGLRPAQLWQLSS